MTVCILGDQQQLARALPLPPAAGERELPSLLEAGPNHFFNDRGEKHMRTATVLSALVAAGLTVGAATAEGQAPSASIQATATVLSALTVTAGNDLAFGNVTQGVPKTVAYTDAGAGTFTVTKAANSAVTLSFTLPTDLDSGTDLLPIGTWTGAWNTSASTAGATAFTPSAGGETTSSTVETTLTVFVGATVTPAAAQTAGNYSGTVTMSAIYF
jgi:hypothetical protein